MQDDRGTWVIRNVDRETREAIAEYAALRGITIADVLRQEFKFLQSRMDVLRRAREQFAAIDNQRTEN